MRPNRSLVVALLCAGAFICSTASAAPGSAAVVMHGKAPEHERTVVASAITDVLRTESWPLREQPLAPDNAQAVLQCLTFDRPWACIAPTARAQGVERIVIAQVDAEKVKEGPQVVITMWLVIPGNATAPIERRICPAKCTDPALVALANEAAKALVRGLPALAKESTTIEVLTDPLGATVLVDGKRAGVTNNVFPVPPGQHEVIVELAGYNRVTRAVTVVEGETLPLTLRLAPQGPAIDDGGGGHADRWWLWPAVAGTGGAALVVVGGIWQANTDPPETPAQPKRLYNGPAIGMIAAGGVAIGVAGYLWLRHSKQRAAPTVSLTNGGGMIGWSATY